MLVPKSIQFQVGLYGQTLKLILLGIYYLEFQSTSLTNCRIFRDLEIEHWQSGKETDSIISPPITVGIRRTLVLIMLFRTLIMENS